MYFRRSLCADPVLSPIVHPWQGKDALCPAACCGMLLYPPLPAVLENRGYALYVLWVVKKPAHGARHDTERRNSWKNLQKDVKIEELMKNEGIVRNRLKIKSAITNARQFIKIQEKYGSFDLFIWSYVDNTPILNHFQSESDIPAKTALSDQISKDLKKLGFKFVGSTIIYAYMQAIGMVNDHVMGCHLYVHP